MGIWFRPLAREVRGHALVRQAPYGLFPPTPHQWCRRRSTPPSHGSGDLLQTLARLVCVRRGRVRALPLTAAQIPVSGQPARRGREQRTTPSLAGRTRLPEPHSALASGGGRTKNARAPRAAIAVCSDHSLLISTQRVVVSNLSVAGPGPTASHHRCLGWHRWATEDRTRLHSTRHAEGQRWVLTPGHRGPKRLVGVSKPRPVNNPIAL
jgi:hypothetical protein